MLEKIIANLERTIKNGGKLEVITVLKRKLKELKKYFLSTFLNMLTIVNIVL